MGTGFDRDLTEPQEGIIPRAVRHLFSGIQALQDNPYDDDGSYLGNLQFSVAAQFMELYNEEIIDLLDPYSKGKVFKIHEDAAGSITIGGATIRPLKGPQDALNCLQQGALARTTASTNMNELSSRSHALFTILIRRQRVMTSEENGSPEDDLETLTSKWVLWQNFYAISKLENFISRDFEKIVVSKIPFCCANILITMMIVNSS